MTDHEFLTTSALRWDVVYSTVKISQADLIQTLFLNQQIPAFIEETESVSAGFLVRVPHDQIEEAQETLHSWASGSVKDAA